MTLASDDVEDELEGAGGVAQAAPQPNLPMLSIRRIEHPEPLRVTPSGLQLAPPRLNPPVVGPFNPLLDPRKERAILGRALAVALSGGAVDLHRLIADISRLKMPRQLPRRPRLSLTHGVLLIVDGGRALQPLAEDIKNLQARLKAGRSEQCPGPRPATPFGTRTRVCGLPWERSAQTRASCNRRGSGARSNCRQSSTRFLGASA